MTSIKRNFQQSLFLSIGSFLFLISSGFSTFIRILGFILIAISFFWNVYRNKIKIITSNLNIILLIICCYSIGIINNLIVSDKTTEIFILTLTLIFIFPFFIIIYNSFNQSIVYSVIIFISKSIIFFFLAFFIFLLLVKDTIGPFIVKSFEIYSGYLYFYYRPAWIFENYPLIWVQASIFAMPLAIWHLFKDNFKLFFLLSLVVFLSLNRTGSFLIVLLFFIKYFKFNIKFIAKHLTTFFTILPIVFISTIIILYLIYFDNFNSEYSGLEIRLGHVLSVVNNLLKNYTWIFGMGADSEFISIGWEGDGVTRDQEISYLEILRRFGLVGFSFFNLAIILLIYKLYNNKNWASFFSLIGFLIFSFTNPCLISFVFVLYVSLITSAPHREFI